MTEVYNAYYNATPLLTYESSPNRRYDMFWITPEVVVSNRSATVTWSERILDELDKYMEAIQNIKALLLRASAHTPVSDQELRIQTDQFRSAVRSYNYALFIFKEEAGYKVDKVALDLQHKFISKKTNYIEAHEELDFYVDAFEDFMHNADEDWEAIMNLRRIVLIMSKIHILER